MLIFGFFLIFARALIVVTPISPEVFPTLSRKQNIACRRFPCLPSLFFVQDHCRDPQIVPRPGSRVWRVPPAGRTARWLCADPASVLAYRPRIAAASSPSRGQRSHPKPKGSPQGPRENAPPS